MLLVGETGQGWLFRRGDFGRSSCIPKTSVDVSTSRETMNSEQCVSAIVNFKPCTLCARAEQSVNFAQCVVCPLKRIVARRDRSVHIHIYIYTAVVLFTRTAAFLDKYACTAWCRFDLASERLVSRIIIIIIILLIMMIMMMMMMMMMMQ